MHFCPNSYIGTLGSGAIPLHADLTTMSKNFHSIKILQ